jgi:hypothetical protein
MLWFSFHEDAIATTPSRTVRKRSHDTPSGMQHFGLGHVVAIRRGTWELPAINVCDKCSIGALKGTFARGQQAVGTVRSLSSFFPVVCSLLSFSSLSLSLSLCAICYLERKNELYVT